MATSSAAAQSIPPPPSAVPQIPQMTAAAEMEAVLVPGSATQSTGTSAKALTPVQKVGQFQQDIASPNRAAAAVALSALFRSTAGPPKPTAQSAENQPPNQHKAAANGGAPPKPARVVSVDETARRSVSLLKPFDSISPSPRLTLIRLHLCLSACCPVCTS